MLSVVSFDSIAEDNGFEILSNRLTSGRQVEVSHQEGSEKSTEDIMDDPQDCHAADGVDYPFEALGPHVEDSAEQQNWKEHHQEL